MESTSLLPELANNSRSLAAGAHEAVDKIANVASHAADKIAEKRIVLNKARTDLLKDCRGYVVENPVVALGVAVAAGVLLRHLVRPR